MTKPRLLAVAIAFAAGAAVLLAVLYWKTAPTVHAPPDALKPLTLTKPEKPAPAVVFTGAGGKLHSLAEFRGRLVLLNLWAPWCGPCVKELPALAALEKKLPAGRFAVVAVDVGREGRDEAAAFLKAHGAASLETYVDANASLLAAFNAYGLPMTALIDAKGNEMARAEGAPDWSHPDSVRYIRELAGP